jgi:hypothetical protein
VSHLAHPISRVCRLPPTAGLTRHKLTPVSLILLHCRYLHMYEGRGLYGLGLTSALAMALRLSSCRPCGLPTVYYSGSATPCRQLCRRTHLAWPVYEDPGDVNTISRPLPVQYEVIPFTIAVCS